MRKRTRIILHSLTALTLSSAVIGAMAFWDLSAKEEQPPGETCRLEEPAGEDSPVQAVLLYEKTMDASMADLGGLQLIDGASAKRTLMVMRIDNLDSPQELKSIRLYKEGFSVVLDVRSYAFDKSVWAILCCDGTFSLKENEEAVLRLALKKENEELRRISVPVKTEALHAGRILGEGEIANRQNAWWLRLPQTEDRVESKDGQIRIVRTVELFGFGDSPGIDPKQLHLVLSRSVPWNAVVRIAGTSMKDGKVLGSSQENTNGIKKITIEVVLKANDIKENENEAEWNTKEAEKILLAVQEILDASRVEVFDFKIPLGKEDQ